MKFTLAIQKKNRANLGQAEGHNVRHHPTMAQLPKAAWFTPEGLHTIKPWNSELVDQAKSLSTRKDAVLAVELVISVGNQTDWREVPDADHPEGKPMSGKGARMNALVAGVKAAVEASDIGWDRVISATLHTDESTPHVHLIFAPILDGKLQAKNWLDGYKKCAAFRKQIYAPVNKLIPCDYTEGAPGGAPHDPEKAAGKSRGVTAGERAAFQAKIQSLEQQVQTLFSQLKAEQKRSEKQLEIEQEKARKVHVENNDFTEKVMKRMEALQAELERLKKPPKPPSLPVPQMQRPQAVLGELLGGLPSGLPPKKHRPAL